MLINQHKLHWTHLTKAQTNLYKSLAILMIVFHNFFANIPSSLGHSEFAFNSQLLMYLLFDMWHHPEFIIQNFFTFFGHFGVQLFIFLSAYGLTRSYFDNTPRWGRFFTKRLIAIYPLFILAMLMYCFRAGFLEYGPLGGFTILTLQWKSLLLKLTFFSNIIPGYTMGPVAPWWFLPFIFQFYMIFPFLVRLTKKYGNYFLLSISIVSILSVYPFNPYLSPYHLNLLYTPIGHLPEFCLGIYFARCEEVKISQLGLVFIAALFVLSNHYYALWMLSYSTLLILMLYFFQTLTAAIKNVRVINTIITYYGSLSFSLFLVHGFFRQPFLRTAIAKDIWYQTILYALASFLLATLAAQILKSIESRIRTLATYLFTRYQRPSFQKES